MIEAALGELQTALEVRFNRLAGRLPTRLPWHRVHVSRQLTATWALIYFHRRTVRVSPYVFLMDPRLLADGSPARELDLTLRHEVAHAWTYRATGDSGHSAPFYDALARLGVRSEAPCDEGPALAAYRFLYRCRGCGGRHPARRRLTAPAACRRCGARVPLARAEVLPDPWERLAREHARVRAAAREIRALPLPRRPSPLVATAPGRPVTISSRTSRL